MNKHIEELEKMAVELQEHTTLPIHANIRIKLFEIADKLSQEHMDFETYLENKIKREIIQEQYPLGDVLTRFRKKIINRK